MAGALARIARVLSGAPNDAPNAAPRTSVAVVRRRSAPMRFVRATAFAAAQLGGILGDWGSAILSSNGETRGAIKVMRGRARDLRRNNPLVAHYAAIAVENILGPDGLTLQAAVPSTRGVNEAASAANQSVWCDWVRTASVDGRSWWDVCAVMVETWKTEGEIGLEIIFDARFKYGVAVQLVDADLIDVDYYLASTATGNVIVSGVELDTYGRPVAYHVLTRHPSDPGPRTRRRIPAERFAVLAHRPRAGQVRGYTPLSPVMVRLYMLNAAQESLAVLHRVAAAKMGFLETTGDDDGDADDDDATTLDGDGSLGEGKAATGDDGSIPWEVAPGVIERLPRNVKFKGWDPGQPTQQYDPFAKSLVREIAVGLNVSYAALSGDLSETSYSSSRTGTLMERDAWRVDQRRFADAVCHPVYAAVLRGALALGKLVTPPGVDPDALACAEWHGRAWDWVDPSKDIAAVNDAIAGCQTTLTRELAARGLTLRAVLEERAKELALAKSLGVDITPPAPKSVAGGTTAPGGAAKTNAQQDTDNDNA